MEAWFLREWQRGSPWQLLLRPFSWLFALIVGIRRRLFRASLLKSHVLPANVIVVGNISVGGTGKTPLVLAIVEQLDRAGRRCGIITRGYVRQDSRAPGALPVRVVPHQYPPACGDEALLLANRSGVPVFAGKDRVAAGRALLQSHPDVDTIVCDDGLQHYALSRDIELCVIDGARGFGNGMLLPAGPLREPLSRLQIVDAIVVHAAAGAGSGNSLDTVAAGVPRYAMSLGREEFVDISGNRRLSLPDAIAEFAGGRVVALAGTGHPARFFEHLHRLGMTLHDTRAFPDHHSYTVHEIAAIDAEFILMTEKDAVKCTGFADARIWFMRVDALVPDALSAFLLERLSTLGKRNVA